MFSDRYKIFLIILLTGSFLYYSFTLYSELPVKTTTVNKEALKGKILWQQYNCNSCHQVYGLGGYLGPDLTNVYSKKGAGYITAFLKSGTEIMPNFYLQRDEINDLLAYLKNIDQSGKSDPRTFTIKKDGTITQE
jgi:nitric oxide reductase subunit C